MLAVAGAPRRWLVLLAAAGGAAAVAAFAGHLLKPYQVDRFLAFTNPDLDPRGAGYNTEQARIAVGNGGLFGQGLFHGSQTRAGFVPEQHTDFIFTVAGEELGLVGAGVLIALLGVVIWRALAISAISTDVFGRVAAAGHRLLVRLPGVPEHRDVPGDHAGDRRTPALRVVRRLVDVRRHARGRPAAEHPPPRHGVPADPLRPPGAPPRLALEWRTVRGYGVTISQSASSISSTLLHVSVPSPIPLEWSVPRPPAKVSS